MENIEKIETVEASDVVEEAVETSEEVVNEAEIEPEVGPEDVVEGGDLSEDEKKFYTTAYNGGYLQGVRDTIKMFLNMGMELGKNADELEKQLYAEPEKDEKVAEEETENA